MKKASVMSERIADIVVCRTSANWQTHGPFRWGAEASDVGMEADDGDLCRANKRKDTWSASERARET